MNQTDLLHAVLDASLNGVMVFESIRDPDDGHIVDFRWSLSNPASCQMVQRAEGELVGARMLDILPGNRHDGLFDRYVQVVEERQAAAFTHSYAHPEEGIAASFRISASPLGDGFVVTFVDVTEASQFEHAMRKSEERLRHIVDNATDMVSMHDVAGNYVYVTPACKDLLGWDPQDLIGTNAYEHFHAPDLEEIRRSHAQVVDEAEHKAAARYRLRRKDGSLVWVETTSKTIADDGRIIAVTRDVTRQAELEDELRRLVSRDALTGVMSRRAVLSSLDAELSRAHRHGRVLSILMLDIDHFKKVNDTHGHDAGDRVLTIIARILRSALRRSDLVGRVGGEEFVVLLPETEPAGAVLLAERIRREVRSVAIRLPQGIIHVTTSIGVAPVQAGDDRDSLLKRADQALYAAKHAGRDKVVDASAAS